MSEITKPKFSNQAQTSPDSPFPSKKDRNLLDLIAAKRKPHDLNATTIPTFPHKPITAHTKDVHIPNSHFRVPKFGTRSRSQWRRKTNSQHK